MQDLSIAEMPCSTAKGGFLPCFLQPVVMDQHGAAAEKRGMIMMIGLFGVGLGSERQGAAQVGGLVSRAGHDDFLEVAGRSDGAAQVPLGSNS